MPKLVASQPSAKASKNTLRNVADCFFLKKQSRL